MKNLLWILTICLLSLILGCGNRATVSEGELVGTWVTNTNTGKEQLVLRPDKTYVQIFLSPTKQFTNNGVWKSNKDSLSGTEVAVIGANLSEDDTSNSTPRRGVLLLQVHREHGQLKLARNTAADWYYERSH